MDDCYCWPNRVAFQERVKCHKSTVTWNQLVWTLHSGSHQDTLFPDAWTLNHYGQMNQVLDKKVVPQTGTRKTQLSHMLNPLGSLGCRKKNLPNTLGVAGPPCRTQPLLRAHKAHRPAYSLGIVLRRWPCARQSGNMEPHLSTRNCRAAGEPSRQTRAQAKLLVSRYLCRKTPWSHMAWLKEASSLRHGNLYPDTTPKPKPIRLVAKAPPNPSWGGIAKPLCLPGTLHLSSIIFISQPDQRCEHRSTGRRSETTIRCCSTASRYRDAAHWSGIRPTKLP